MTADTIFSMRDCSSAQIVSEMKIGWNLGNTLDCLTGRQDGLAAETAWGNPPVTKALFEAVSAAGFGAVRIPVTWVGHFGQGPDYLIDPVWLDRVEEIVRWALECGLYVILNLHHDGADFPERGAWLRPDYQSYDKVLPRFTALWTQLAHRFAQYGDRLLFESMNEPHCGDDWVGSMEQYIIVNRLNELFVETVRSAGGNNKLRHLMLPSYAASPKRAPVEAMIYPQDERLILTVHAYTPTEFCFPSYDVHWAEPRNDWGTDEDHAKLTGIMELLHGQGRPVIIGEMGAVQKFKTDNRLSWADFFVREAAKRGIVCFWWDAFTQGETMGLLDRSTLQWADQTLVDTLMNAVSSAS